MAIESRELMDHPLYRAYAASIERIRASEASLAAWRREVERLS